MGMTIGTVLMHAFFNDEDKFFNRVPRAAWHLMLVNICFAILSTLFGFYYVTKGYSRQLYLDDHP